MSAQFVPPFLLLILLSSACPFSLAFSSDISPNSTGNGTNATTDRTDTTGNSDLMTNATLPEETTAKEEEGTTPGTDGTAGGGNGTAEPPKEGDESPQESFACSVLCWTLIIVGGVFICAVGLTAFVLLTVHYQNARADPNNPSAAVQMSAIPRGMTAH
ncbi:hypothetical protein niasHT_004605 [Heterodera trifolii]|uniref:Uncharacterized protein n=1 Tax=Heterodera trifolii TaxID=157864 RepID=A0ABD2M814_9BILA